MAETKLCFKNAFKKFLNKTDSLKESQNNEFSHTSEAQKLQNCENSIEITEAKSPDSANACKQMSLNSVDLQKQSFQDVDKLLSEHIHILRSLCVTEKDSSARKENDFPSLESRPQLENFTNNRPETGDKFEFFSKAETELDPETFEVENFFSGNVSENLHDNGTCYLSNADPSEQISPHHNDNSQNLKPAELHCLIAHTRVLKKQEHQELEHYRKLFIGNFDEDIDTEELYYYFLQFGKIERTINIRNHKAKSKYIGYIIVFEKIDSVTTVQTAAPHVIHNKTLKLYLPKNDGCEPEEFCKLFVGNLSNTTTENDLRNYFQRWGKLVNCVVERKSETNISKCYGSVTFKFFLSANDALLFPYHRIRGRSLKVDVYREGRPTYQGLNKFKHAYSTKFASGMARNSFSGAQKMDKKSLSNKNMRKKEFLTERQMLTIIKKSKIFKPMVINLNDFEGAGVNIFNKSSLPKLKSSNFSSDNFSTEDAKPIIPKL